MSNPEYDAYLASPEWKTRRKIALDHAGHRCQFCNSDKQPLEVHHRTYERIRNEQAGDLTVLCADCHGKLSGENGQAVPPFTNAGMAGETELLSLGSGEAIACGWFMAGVRRALAEMQDALGVDTGKVRNATDSKAVELWRRLTHQG